MLARFLLALISFALFVTAGTAQASVIVIIDFPQGCGILVRGNLVAADVANFERLTIERADCQAVALDSEYGQENAAMRIGTIIRTRKLMTIVPAGASCAGPCVLAFLGGVVRVVDPKARIGLRMPTVSRDSLILRETRRIIQKHGANATEAILTNVERMMFEVAAGLTRYVVMMVGSTDLIAATAESGTTITRWLSRAQIAEMRISGELKD